MQNNIEVFAGISNFLYIPRRLCALAKHIIAPNTFLVEWTLFLACLVLMKRFLPPQCLSGPVLLSLAIIGGINPLFSMFSPACLGSRSLVKLLQVLWIHIRSVCCLRMLLYIKVTSIAKLTQQQHNSPVGKPNLAKNNTLLYLFFPYYLRCATNR